jgi:hypothetical protein
VVSSNEPGTKAHNFTAPFIGSIDQGTSSSRFILFDSLGKVVEIAQTNFEQIYPKPGWAEHNPNAILDSVNHCIAECMERVKEKYGLTKADVAAVGITNQRETTVVWDKEYGLPLHNAIVWHDVRTSDVVKDLVAKAGGDKDKLAKECGLPLSTYFSGVKLKWLFDNVGNWKRARWSKRLNYSLSTTSTNCLSSFVCLIFCLFARFVASFCLISGPGCQDCGRSTPTLLRHHRHLAHLQPHRPRPRNRRNQRLPHHAHEHQLPHMGPETVRILRCAAGLLAQNF